MDPLTQIYDLGNIVLAALLGGAIGWEREAKNKPAGLRTHMLVCASAATLVSIGQTLILQFDPKTPAGVTQSDPIRIIQAVIIGISFIGSGVIEKKDGAVHNLTTAATLLIATAVGLAVGFRQYWLAIGCALIILAINTALRRLEKAETEDANPRQDHNEATKAERMISA
jgi:putative Mg2+ transporter-C (MgtC) family protein